MRLRSNAGLPPEPRNARALLKDTLASLRDRLPQLFGFELVIRLIAWAVVIPVSTWLSTRLIATTGQLAVANQQILEFLLRPAGILTVGIVVITDLAARMANLAGPMLIVAGARRGETIRAFVALVRVAALLPRLVWLGLHMVGRFLLIAGPLAAVAAFVAVRLLSDRDIYYYVTIRPTEFWIAAAVAGSVGVALGIAGVVMLARWLFSVPVLLFEDLGGAAALARSRELARGSFRRLVRVIVGWALIAGLIASAISLLGNGMGELASAAFGGDLDLLVPVLGVFLAAYLASRFALDVAGSLVLALLVFHVFLDQVGAEGPDAAELVTAPGTADGALRRAASVPRWARWAAVSAVVIAAVTVTATLSERLDLQDQVAITAHRGSSLRAPENTLAAIELAIAEGADFAEIDVQETADGVVVLLHDEDLGRVTGMTRNIWEVTWAELRDLDAGSWFSADFANERIPSLQEAIDVARGRIGLNIELKYNGHEDALSRRVVDLVRANGVQDEIVLTSLSYEGLLDAAGSDSTLAVGFVVARSVGDPWRLDVDFLSVERRLVDGTTADRAHSAGKRVHVWSVNDPLEMSRLIDLGVDNLITDDPLLARSVLEERAQLSDVERLILFIRSRLSA